jgi:predicted aspartyl protease
MIYRLIYGLGLLLGSVAIASPVSAKECGPLKMLASANLALQPGNRPMVPVTVNGASKQFLLDTGGIFTNITPKAVHDLQLKIEVGARPIFDVSGDASSGYVKLDTFSFGGMTGKNVYLRVWPSNTGADGAIAPDLLNRYDVEVDFAGQKMNYFEPDHCPGKVIYWPHGDVAQVSIVLADKRWIKVPVKLDGQSFMAIIDTGTTGTTMGSDTALASFGLSGHSPDMEPAGNVNHDPNLASYYHTFSSLTLDGITVKNPRIIIMPDRMSDADKMVRGMHAPSVSRNSRLALPELLLGMDILKNLHLYFAFQEHNLYVTAAGPSSVSAATASPKAVADAPKLSPNVLQIMRVALAAFNKKDFVAALAAVNDARAVSDRTPYDDYMINRYAASCHVLMQDLAAAEADAEAAADTDPAVIPDAQRAVVYKSALQLSLNAKKYAKAAKYAKLYQATNPPASDQALIRAALKQGDAD